MNILILFLKTKSNKKIFEYLDKFVKSFYENTDFDIDISEFCSFDKVGKNKYKLYFCGIDFGKTFYIPFKIKPGKIFYDFRMIYLELKGENNE